MKKELQYKIIRLEKLLLISIGMIIIIFGALLNMFVIVENKGKMPVLSNYEIESDTHFSFQRKNEIKDYFLADIIKVSNRVFSIGDIMAFLGLSLMLYNCFELYELYNIARKNRKYHGKRKKTRYKNH